MVDAAQSTAPEFAFELPYGFVDGDNQRHRAGAMRLATAFDEIAPLKDPRVQQNPGYILVILLSRVITRLGTLEYIHPKVIENLFASDLIYLQDMYVRLNRNGRERMLVTCPHCEGDFEVEGPEPGK